MCLQVPLVVEVVAHGHSVLIFCASRKACQTTAKLLADELPNALVEAPGRACATMLRSMITVY